MAVAQTTLEQELERAGVRVSVNEFQELVLEAVRQLPTTIVSENPAGELTEAERDALLKGGGTFEPLPPGTPDPRARTAAKYATLLASSFKVDDVAKMLGVDPSRIRQRLKERSMYGIKTREGWRIPRFQFDGCRMIPGVERVIAAMPIDEHPLGFFNWFTLPDPDFWIDDVSVSPSEWLRHGGDPARVVELAASFEFGL
jgi:hypothetical protein